MTTQIDRSSTTSTKEVEALLKAGRYDDLVQVIGMPRFISLIESGEVAAVDGWRAMDRFVDKSRSGIKDRLFDLLR